MRRWIATHFAEEVARERVTVPRGPVDAGSEAQIDYGRLGMWFDPATARRVAVWAFVMVLAFSRHLFVRPVIRMDQTAWCACHVAAFEFFDGVPARLVCDNLRTGVDKPDLYDPQINRSYAELASHYATLVDPARARKPKDKPRVELPMTYVRDSFWKGREFDSLAQMQQAAVTWSTEVAGLRYLRALEGAQPLRMFEAVEQQALIALPPRAFELTSWSIGTVGVDTHLKVGKALYSVPWRLIGQRLHARTAGDVVQIFAGNDVVATHVRRPSGRSTDFSHYPPEKIAFHMRTPTWCRHTAELVGPACQQVIAEFMRDNAIHHLRSAQGVLGLRDKHGCDRLEAACARAIEVGDPSYRTIKGILVAGTEHAANERTTSSPASTAGAFLRGPEQFGTDTPRRLISQRNPEPSRHNPHRYSQGEASMSICDPALRNALRTLKLSGMLDTLDARLAQTRNGDLGHLEFLQALREDEIARRESAALTRRLRRAKFEAQATFEDFDFTANPKLPGAMLRDLAALRWLDAGESVILHGPVGVGKTHVAQALVHAVARRGGDVRFAKTSRMLSDLAGGHADRSWGQRIREYTKPLVLILDDFAMREHTAMHADDLYELISDRAITGKPLILTSNRAPNNWYGLFPNPVVAESLLDRLINTSHQILMDGPSYRPRKRPGRTTS